LVDSKAPEVLRDREGKGHTETVDIWAYGILLFMLLTQEPPFFSENRRELFELIKNRDVNWSIYDELSPLALSFLKAVCINAARVAPSQMCTRISLTHACLRSQLLNKDEHMRLGCGEQGIQEIKNHPFFAGIDWRRMQSKKYRPPYKPAIGVCAIMASEIG
jgi:serine/threonine protein kinase